MNDWLAFDNYAQSTKRAAEKRAEKAALTRKEKRKIAARENAHRLDENDKLSKAYRYQRRQDLEKLLEYPGADDLLKFLRGMKISDSAEALTRVRKFADAPFDVRFEILRRVQHHIFRVRQANNLAPIDDPLPWLDDRPNLFMRCKALLRID